MSESRFIDKLRKATKEGEPDSQLVDECMELVNKFAPNIANEIPSNTQKKMLDAARRQENSLTFNSLDQLENFVSWSYGKHNEKIEQKFSKLCHAALKNTKVNVLDGALGCEELGPWITWKIKNDKYSLQLNISEKKITVMFNPSWETVIKIFKNQGFKVTPLYNNKILNLKIIGITVEW